MRNELTGRRTIEEWTSHGFAVERFVGDPVLTLFDHRLLAFGLLTVPFDGDNVGSVHRPHDIEVFPLTTHLNEFVTDRLEAHDLSLE